MIIYIVYDIGNGIIESVWDASQKAEAQVFKLECLYPGKECVVVERELNKAHFYEEIKKR